MKYELKFEYTDKEKLENLIKFSYFYNENGKLINKDTFLFIDKEDAFYELIKDIEYFIKITNPVIDGFIKMIPKEDKNGIGLYPVQLYCIFENDKYSFF